MAWRWEVETVESHMFEGWLAWHMQQQTWDPLSNKLEGKGRHPSLSFVLLMCAMACTCWHTHSRSKRTQKKHCPNGFHFFLLLHLWFHWGTSDGDWTLSSDSSTAALCFLLTVSLGIEWVDSASCVFNFPWADECPKIGSSPRKSSGARRPIPPY